MRLTVSGAPDAHTKRRTPSLPASVGSAIIIALLLVIAWLDYDTGTAPIQHLYYLPIILAALIFDYWGGLACALAAIISYHLANQHLRALNYVESDYMQVVLFLTVGAITARLARDRRAMQRLAGTDDLTGLYNLRSFESKLLAIVSRAQARRTHVSMLVLDVDGLKGINDTHGHLAGAEAVREVGHIIAGTFQGSAVACRYGGDEFAIVLPDCDAGASLAAAEILRKTVEGQQPVLAGRQFPAGALTVSIGIAIYLSDGARRPELVGEELFRAADHALYQAKREGRNRVRLDAGTTAMPQLHAEPARSGD
ncbi:MAG TPA: diguanylate cyclase [Pyrinomonadaceae bacterium]|nr:diguanylate cyclase [Pyrinomonadaceae bacterium]